MIARPVLVVEDDVDLASTLAEALEVAGIASTIAVDGRAALAALRTQTPSVILLDLMMPTMDGWEFRAEQLKDPRAAAIPVVVMTASGRAEQAAKELGANGFLDKPLGRDALIAEVHRVAPETASSSDPH